MKMVGADVWRAGLVFVPCCLETEVSHQGYDHDGKSAADGHRSETEASVLLRLGEKVADRCAERSRVREPKRQNRVQPRNIVCERYRSDDAAASVQRST